MYVLRVLFKFTIIRSHTTFFLLFFHRFCLIVLGISENTASAICNGSNCETDSIVMERNIRLLYSFWFVITIKSIPSCRFCKFYVELGITLQLCLILKMPKGLVVKEPTRGIVISVCSYLKTEYCKCC